ncbi:unnamed protein product [Euphydryas editha]|uniref:Uncharacterized protein n=1 Tax=Euphydryas editha TaxID=104508 RepID=A0AAU9V6A6_EUPED|nr:unnamed protein product [Euphydryas editha]
MAAILKLAVVLFVFLYADFCKSEDLVLGATNGSITYVEDVKLNAFPFMTRTKNVFYSGSQVIKGISAIDVSKGKSKVTVTAGGVGSMFANVRLKSRRGDELNYVVQIFV